jgi:predicted GIY-YIG superfamily endonuclease
MTSKYVYLIKSKESQHYKIGISTNPHKRILQLETGNSEQLQIIHIYRTFNYNSIEKALHNRFLYLKINREWFKFDVEIELNFLNYCKLYDDNITLIKNNTNFI